MREPWIAGILSLLVPGVGQIYNGRILVGRAVVDLNRRFVDRLSRTFRLGGSSDRRVVCL